MARGKNTKNSNRGRAVIKGPASDLIAEGNQLLDDIARMQSVSVPQLNEMARIISSTYSAIEEVSRQLKNPRNNALETALLRNQRVDLSSNKQTLLFDLEACVKRLTPEQIQSSGIDGVLISTALKPFQDQYAAQFNPLLESVKEESQIIERELATIPNVHRPVQLSLEDHKRYAELKARAILLGRHVSALQNLQKNTHFLLRSPLTSQQRRDFEGVEASLGRIGVRVNPSTSKAATQEQSRTAQRATPRPTSRRQGPPPAYYDANIGTTGAPQRTTSRRQGPPPAYYDANIGTTGSARRTTSESQEQTTGQKQKPSLSKLLSSIVSERNKMLIRASINSSNAHESATNFKKNLGELKRFYPDTYEKYKNDYAEHEKLADTLITGRSTERKANQESIQSKYRDMTNRMLPKEERLKAAQYLLKSLKSEVDGGGISHQERDKILQVAERAIALYGQGVGIPQQTVPPVQRRPSSRPQQASSGTGDTRLDKLLSTISQNSEGLVENMAKDSDRAYTHARDLLANLGKLKQVYPEKYEEVKEAYKQNEKFARQFVTTTEKRKEVEKLLKTNETLANHESLTPETRFRAAQILLETVQQEASSIRPKERTRLSTLAQGVIAGTSRQVKSSPPLPLDAQSKAEAKERVNRLYGAAVTSFGGVEEDDKRLDAKIELNDALRNLPEGVLTEEERSVYQSTANEGLLEVVESFDKHYKVVQEAGTSTASDRYVKQSASALKGDLEKIPDSVISPANKARYKKEARQAVANRTQRSHSANQQRGVQQDNQATVSRSERSNSQELSRRIQPFYATIASSGTSAKDKLTAATELRTVLTPSARKALGPSYVQQCDNVISFAYSKANERMIELQSVINSKGGNDRFGVAMEFRELARNMPAELLPNKVQVENYADNVCNQILEKELSKLQKKMDNNFSSNATRLKAAEQIRNMLTAAREGKLVNPNYKSTMFQNANERIRISIDKLQNLNAQKARVRESSAPKRRSGMRVGSWK